MASPFFSVQESSPNKKFLPQNCEKSSASAQRQATHTNEKFQDAAISVKGATLIFRGLNLCGAHCMFMQHEQKQKFEHVHEHGQKRGHEHWPINDTVAFMDTDIEICHGIAKSSIYRINPSNILYMGHGPSGRE